jgi:glycosyltransferase involved in cell wall biosynthesis
MMEACVAAPPASAVRVRRVLMTADAVGGVWRYGIDLGRSLARHRVAVTLAVMGPAPSRAQRRDAARAGICLVESGYRLEWMDDAAADVARAGDWLMAVAREVKPDIAHLNGYAHAALPWPCPVVVVAHSCVRSWWRAVHGTDAPPRYTAYAQGVSAGLAAAHAVVAPTRAILDEIAGIYGLGSPGVVIPNGHADPADRLDGHRPRKRPMVLMGGRLWDAAKNVAAVCAVAPRVRWPIYVAGSATNPNGTPLPLDGVHPLGQLSAREMRAWYRRASIYALPARYEPFGLSVLEAARAECALVLGDIPSLRENWDGAALFVRPGDQDALAAAFERLIADEPLRSRLAARACAMSASFNIARTAHDYLRLYQSLLT